MKIIIFVTFKCYLIPFEFKSVNSLSIGFSKRVGLPFLDAKWCQSNVLYLMAYNIMLYKYYFNFRTTYFSSGFFINQISRAFLRAKQVEEKAQESLTLKNRVETSRSNIIFHLAINIQILTSRFFTQFLAITKALSTMRYHFSSNMKGENFRNSGSQMVRLFLNCPKKARLHLKVRHKTDFSSALTHHLSFWPRGFANAVLWMDYLFLFLLLFLEN